MYRTKIQCLRLQLIPVPLRLSSGLVAILMIFGLTMTHANAAEQPIDNLAEHRAQWQAVTDQVMGGVSAMELQVQNDGEASFYRMTGSVSTANNGGFIQFRTRTAVADPSLDAIKVKVRGNGERYYVHLRTKGLMFPWSYYAADFVATSEWQTIVLPFSQFAKSSRFMSKRLDPNAIQTLGIVAYGRDHEAALDVASVSFVRTNVVAARPEK